MSHASDLIATDINAYLRQHERKELLRFLTCGSVDDGKSTLIGRLLYDAKMIYEDQLAAIRRDTSRHGTTGTDFDPALLTDGLKAEREQGITIDVAYRYFSTAKRKFIIADTPGHEQYTRNMVTGASNCDLAIILIDARKGLLVQTRRHSFFAALLGIRHVVVAVNKMDLVDYREEVFAQIQSDYAGLAAKLDLRDVTFIPVAALHGDNIVDPSANMPWYRGSTLMYHLENVHIASDRNLIDLRLPVQLVNRPNADFRGFCGTVASGVVRVGDEIMALPSRRTSRVKSIVTFDGELTEAIAPLAITLTLADEVDISRGDMLVRPGNLPRVGTSFDAMVVWMSPTPLVPGRQYLIKHATRSTFGAVSSLRYQIDVNTLHRRPAATLALNEIGRCEVTVERPLAYDAYVRNRATGAFIIIDRLSNETVGAGMILEHDGAGTKRSHWDTPPVSGTLEMGVSQVTASEREARFGQKPATVLFTGPSGSGKTTLARAVERRLFDLGRACAVLDGAALRQSISRDLGFSPAERSENLRRGAELARLMNEAGLICLAAFVAPQESARRRAAELVGTDRFLVVELTALPVDQNTGHSSSATTAQLAAPVRHGEEVAYEPPIAPDLTIDLRQNDVAEEVERVLALLRMRDFIR